MRNPESGSSLSISIHLLGLLQFQAVLKEAALLPLLVPDPRIDSGVEEIGDQVAEDDTQNHDDRDRFVQWES